MKSLPEHAIRNREAWTKFSQVFAEPGLKSWSTDEISWGEVDALEREIQALGPLSDLNGKDVIELGCGTAYFSAWFAKFGAHPIGVDITPAQLANARKYQDQFGIQFPIIQASAENVPLRSESFDIAFSEYGASIWCDPHIWIPEAYRLLRSGGRLIFLRNSTIATLCMPLEGSVTQSLQRPAHGLNRLEWSDDESVEFHLPTGEMFKLLADTGFMVEKFIELYATQRMTDREYMKVNWAQQWPAEEIWVARKS